MTHIEIRMDYMIFGFILIGVLLITILQERDKRKKTKLFYRKNYGKKEADKDIMDRLDTISFYSRLKSNINTVDEITWNDLGLNDVFSKISLKTASNIGEEYLYYMLHKLEYNNEVLNSKEELIQFFDQNEEIRVEVQYQYSKFQKLYGYSAYQCIEDSKTLIEKPIVPHILMAASFLTALFSVFISLKIGGVILALVIIYNIIEYYKAKRFVENSHFISLRYLAKMLRLSKKICKIEAEELGPYQKELRIIWSKFSKISRYSFLFHIGTGFITDTLELLLDYIRIVTHVDFICLYSLSGVIKREEEWLDRFLEIIGIIDATIAIASYRRQLSYYCIPTLIEDEKLTLEISDLYHPLIEEPVRNSIDMNKGVLLTGSNASGKSTFIKAVAINAILSQTINTSFTKKYCATFYRVLTSMALKDDILNNESYYIVEIKAIKRILDQSEDSIPMLCCIDEVLRGTNTLERIAASSEILKYIAEKNAICIAATHDIELTYLLNKQYDNYHFKEEIKESRLSFPFKIIPGPATTRNAIKLLETMDYPDSIFLNAKKLVEYFERSGKWTLD